MGKVIPEMDSKTMDIVAENVSKLKELFPEAFTEGKVDFEVLKEVLGEYVDGREERYSFTWNGKSKARMIAQTPSAGTLRPCKDESVDWDTTQNLFIEGDNLEVLKLLQKSYHKKVKMIYIDPPYNTGNDFVYKDDFKDNIKNYKEITGQADSEGRSFSSNPETSGRYHTNWLNMMLPRLKLARSLLRDEGVICISINDKELYNLKLLIDQIFGEENFIATLVWEKGRKNDAKRVSVGHEYMVLYAKNLSFIEEITAPWREHKEGITEIIETYNEAKKSFGEDYEKISEKLVSFYKFLPPDHPSKKYARSRFVDKRGIWRDNNITWPGGGGPKYDVIHPITGKPCKVPDDGWRFVEATMIEKIRDGYIHFREDHTQPPILKSYLYIDPDSQTEDEEVGGKKQVMGSVFYRHSQPSNDVIKELFGDKVFENPKDHEILARLINYCTDEEDIILDFFAGSGSTAQAIYELNNKYSSKRKFILVQLPELCSKDSLASSKGFSTIAEISKKRILLAAAKIKEDNPNYQGDLGFKVFKLDSTNIKPWELDFDLTEQDLEDQIDNIKYERMEEDVLYEILLKYGLDLTLPIKEHRIAGHKVFDIGMGALMICLSDDISLEVVEGIAKLKEELNPEIMRVVFKDSGFANDVIKTNAVQILKQVGIEDVRSL